MKLPSAKVALLAAATALTAPAPADAATLSFDTTYNLTNPLNVLLNFADITGTTTSATGTFTGSSGVLATENYDVRFRQDSTTALNFTVVGGPNDGRATGGINDLSGTATLSETIGSFLSIIGDSGAVAAGFNFGNFGQANVYLGSVDYNSMTPVSPVPALPAIFGVLTGLAVLGGVAASQRRRRQGVTLAA